MGKWMNGYLEKLAARDNGVFLGRVTHVTSGGFNLRLEDSGLEGNVDLRQDPIEKITSTGVRTATGEHPLAAAIVSGAEAIEYLDILPAGPDLVGAEIELVSAEGREHKLAEAIARYLNEFDDESQGHWMAFDPGLVEIVGHVMVLPIKLEKFAVVAALVLAGARNE